jgi:hypothetical protein
MAVRDGGDRGPKLAGAWQAALAPGMAALHPEETVLAGWETQQRSRYLRPATIEDGLRVVRRFVRSTNAYPRQWAPADVEDWTSQLVSGARPVAHSTVRTYRQTLARLLGYATDRRYGWVAAREERFGRAPAQIYHEWNRSRIAPSTRAGRAIGRSRGRNCSAFGRL